MRANVFDGAFPGLLAEHHWTELLMALTFGIGFIGVPMFFVISGFCIHLPNVKRTELDAGTYLRRRLLRIYPLYLVIVLLVFGINGWLLGHGAADGITLKNFIGHLFFWYYAESGSDGMGITPVLWTISIEVQFYLFYLIGFSTLRRWGLGKVTLIALLVGLVYRVAWQWWLQPAGASVGWQPDRLAPARMGEWLLGACAAQWWLSGGSRWIGSRAAMIAGAALVVLGILAGCYLPLERNAATDLPASLGFFLILLGLLPAATTAAKKTTSGLGRLFGYIGQRSYAIYLSHLLALGVVITMAGKIGGEDWRTQPPLVVAMFVITPLLSLAVAEPLYRLVEKPSHVWARGGAGKGKPSQR